ncbi:MAG: hypothetical protein AB7F75_08670 [Planctomycetota bacterium]
MAADPASTEARFDELIRLLRLEGHEGAAREFDMMIHHMAWTTGSEWVGELGLKLRAFRKTGPRMSPALKKQFKICCRQCGLLWGWLPW